MTRFVLFIALLVGIAYVLTEPPESKMALSANEIPIHNDKPLLTSWGPTLGSLRDGIRVRPRAPASNMLAANDTSEPYGSDSSSSTGTVQTAAVAAKTLAEDHPDVQRHKPTTVASVQEPTTHKPPVAEPAVDRIAAALPPQRRGLFSRALAPQAAQDPRETREVRAAPRNRGLFKRLLGRGKQPTRAWALGPAR
ncbi:hypothetical protein [Methyloceanibacter caenitepidi]|uniref:Uncharacterized protein n=1 Tax=Methyloceanibacter caenitepidi TaxID=1384459 RepID=A0A0A8K1U7_9HYPH|nr:hypothetical protein [Methyloceanibacter caenitepidi]BAQ16776.1 hypothetical protein GL4_1318 [Methyloceanibacter caenitepidi]